MPKYDELPIPDDEGKLPIDAIVPDPDNENYHTEEGVSKLASMMEAAGQLNPIIVRPAKGLNAYQIVCGERRWLAAQTLGWKAIKATIRILDDEEAALYRGVENFWRDFSFISECKVYAGFHRKGYSLRTLEKVFRESQGYIGIKIRIGYFPESLLEQLLINPIWKPVWIRELLPLRLGADGLFLDESSTSIDQEPGEIDYSEVQKVIMMVNSGKIDKLADLKLQVSQRREELVRSQIQVQVELRLSGELDQIAEATQERLEEGVREKLESVEEQYKAEVAHLQGELSNVREALSSAQAEKARLQAGKEREQEVAEIQAQYDRGLREKEAEIFELRGRFSTLESSIESIKAGVSKQAESIARDISRKSEEALRKDLEREYGRMLDAARENFDKQIEALRVKEEIKIDRVLATVDEKSGELVNMIGMLTSERLHLLNPSQRKRLAFQIDSLIESLEASVVALERGHHPESVIVEEGR